MNGCYSFRPAQRLKKAEEFAQVLSRRQVLHGRYFSLHYAPSLFAAEEAGSGRARLGLVVAKRLARRAVLRNLVKRLARESFRLSRPELADLDIVLRLTKPLTQAAPRKASQFSPDQSKAEVQPTLSKREGMKALKAALRSDLQALLARLPRR